MSMMLSYENTITFIFFVPALLCVFIGLFSTFTCGCCCFCNNERDSLPPTRRRGSRCSNTNILIRHRNHYTQMSDCEDAQMTTRLPASWRCRGNGPHNAMSVYRDRRLCSDFDMMTGPSPPSYTVSMQQCYNYVWNQPSAANREASAASSVRMVESNHSHVHNVSLIRLVSRTEGSKETRLDDVEEEEEEQEEEGDARTSPPPPYDNVVTKNPVDKDGH